MAGKGVRFLQRQGTVEDGVELNEGVGAGLAGAQIVDVEHAWDRRGRRDDAGEYQLMNLDIAKV